jgi:hypothetical protein
MKIAELDFNLNANSFASPYCKTLTFAVCLVGDKFRVVPELCLAKSCLPMEAQATRESAHLHSSAANRLFHQFSGHPKPESRDFDIYFQALLKHLSPFAPGSPKNVC